MGRCSLNLRKNTVSEKNSETTQSIEIEEPNAWVCDDVIFKNKNFKHKFPKNKISCILHKFSSNKLILHKIQSICKNLVG